MKIVLRPCEYDSYYLNTFENTEDAIKFLKENCFDDLKDYKFYDAKELELDLKLKEVNNDDILS